MKKLLTAAWLCSVMVLPLSAQAQSVDVGGNTAGATALTERGTTLDGKNSTAGAATASPGLRAEMAPAPNSNTHIVPKPTPKGGAGKTIACNVCHGEGLKGLGDVPGIAGIHPIYVVRQLYDIKVGANTSSAAALMKKVVEKLTDDDMIAIAAYTASLAP